MKLKRDAVIILAVMLMATVVAIYKDQVNWIGDAHAANEPPPKPPQPNLCPVYNQPKLPELPDIKTIPDNVARDRKATEEYLLKVITEHRKVMIESYKQLEASYQDYIRKCTESKSPQ